MAKNSVYSYNDFNVDEKNVNSSIKFTFVSDLETYKDAATMRILSLLLKE